MKKCALVIGHKRDNVGASNGATGLSEFVFNEALASEVKSVLEASNVDIEIVYRRTYDSLPSDINKLKPDFIISLHCNACNRKVTGTEVLYYHQSSKGKLIAEILLGHLVGALGLEDRGIKPRTSEERGGHLLQKTIAPCIIAEPFFIDNDGDLKVVMDNRANLIEAYAEAIKAIANSLEPLP